MTDGITLQEHAGRLVSMHVTECVSQLVYGLTKAELSGKQFEAIGISEDDLVDAWYSPATAADFRERAASDIEGLQVAQDGDSWKWKSGEGMWSPPFDSELEAWRDAFDDLGQYEPQSEVFEHWIVSDWLADRLEERGERILRDFAGLTIWGRPTTGQSIKIDAVIEDITRAYFIEPEPASNRFDRIRELERERDAYISDWAENMSEVRTENDWADSYPNEAKELAHLKSLTVCKAS